MIKKLILLLVVILLVSGCSLHYMNEKGIKANADDIKTKAGNIKEANGYFHSTVDLWIPNRPKENK